MTVGEDLASRAGPCAACGYSDFFEGNCRVCGKPVVSTDKAEEPLEPLTTIPLPPKRPPISFPVSQPTPKEYSQGRAVTSVPPDETSRQRGVHTRASLQRRVEIALCALLAFATALSLVRWIRLAPQDPLSEFAVIAATDTEAEKIDEWARQQFGGSVDSVAADRMARARAALELTMVAATARDDRRSMDWNQVASWANIAQALGFHDVEMLELAADLNLQIALHTPGISEAEALRRVARARVLLKRRSMNERDDAVWERMARKSADMDRIELVLRGRETGQP